MRHRKSGRKLGRNASHRDAMFRNMVTSLFESEKIQTTDAKAKELRRVAERLITLGKRNAPSLVEAAAEFDPSLAILGLPGDVDIVASAMHRSSSDHMAPAILRSLPGKFTGHSVYRTTVPGH